MSPKVNTCYLLTWNIVIGLGMLQYGLVMAAYNFMTDLIPLQLGVDSESQKTLYNSLIAASAPVGALIGAMVGGSFSIFGRRPAILFINVLICIGIGISLIQTLWTLMLGRFIFGFGAGAFTVTIPSFINEVTPAKLRGTMGTISQLMVCFGILLSYAVGISVVPIGAEDQKDSGTWRIVFGFPIIFAILQFILILAVF